MFMIDIFRYISLNPIGYYTQKSALRGIKDWVHGFLGCNCGKIYKCESLKKLFTVVTCSPTLIVYCDAIFSYSHKQL